MVAAAWYRKPSEEVLQELGTGPAGLHEKTAAEKLESHGPNRLPEAKRVSRVVILLRQFASPLIYILLIAAAVTFALAEYKDTIVIAAVLLFNAIIGFIQESRAEESVRALQKMIVPQARVVREGREREIRSEGLVPGDIVLLASGAKVPADIRLVSAIEMRIDESLLTGESVPAEKFAAAIPEANLTPGDQRNIAFMGTVVVNGRGTGVVVETGARTVLGGIAHEIRETKAARAPLQEKFARFSNRIGLYVLAAASALFAVGIAVGEPVREMFMTVVAAAVASIPEGLPVVLTIALAVGVQRMAARNAILAETAGRGDPGEHDGHLHGQDGDPHEKRDDGQGGLRRGAALRADGDRLRAEGGDPPRLDPETGSRARASRHVLPRGASVQRVEPLRG